MSATNQKAPVSAIVLAAGMSSRMGTAKQLLPIGQHTLLGQTLQNLRESSVGEIILVLGFRAEEIQAQIVIDGLRIVTNEAYREGMASSLRLGISMVDSAAEAALIVLADQPLVRPGTLNQLIVEYQTHRPEILIPLYRGFRGNPVLLDRAVFPEVSALSGDIGFRAIFGNHVKTTRRIAVADPGILLDADSLEDMETLRQAYANADGLVALPEFEERTAAPVVSQPQLILVGHDAMTQTLATLGRLLNFTVTVADPFLTLQEAPEADAVLRVLDFTRLTAASARYVVVATQGRFDEEAVEHALLAECAYVALVASKRRAQQLTRSLQERGVAPEKIAALRAPGGFEIGAETPAEIALSIMAQIVSEYHLNQAGKRHIPA